MDYAEAFRREVRYSYRTGTATAPKQRTTSRGRLGRPGFRYGRTAAIFPPAIPNVVSTKR